MKISCKTLLKSIITLGFHISLLANTGHINQSSESYPEPHWHQTAKGKDRGSFQSGLEFLIMTSTFTSVISDTGLLTQDIQAGPTTVAITDRNIKSINPEYNLGLAVDFAYITPGENDIGVYYKYLRNNGSGSLKKDVERNRDGLPDFGVPGILTTIDQQNDRGNIHSHLHIADLLYGHTFHLNAQLAFRLGGGLSYHNFDLRAHFQDDDSIKTSFPALPDQTLKTFKVHSHQKFSLWGLGPKLETAFQCNFLPSTWNHDLTLHLKAQFSLLYSKQWGSGHYSNLGTFDNNGVITHSITITNWKQQPSFEFIPNINLDMGIQYDYHSSNGLIFEWGIGYRLFSFWELEQFNVTKNYTGGLFEFEDHFAYAGPYISFSLTY